MTIAPLTNFDIGFVAAAAIAAIAYRLRTLDAGGALAAVAVGTATYGALALPGAGVLLAFFVTSVGLSRVGKKRKAAAFADIGKTGPRDFAQVFANGGVAALCALLTLWAGPRYAIAFAGAFAAATADTWGTEIGGLARGLPRSLLTFRPVATGLSGGVTLQGTLAEAAGAIAIAAAALALSPQAFLPVALGGFTGAVADSLLGASLQSLRWCPACGRATEREPHGCGANTTQLRGLAAFSNDVTNYAATLVGACVAFALAG